MLFYAFPPCSPPQPNKQYPFLLQNCLKKTTFNRLCSWSEIENKIYGDSHPRSFKVFVPTPKNNRLTTEKKKKSCPLSYKPNVSDVPFMSNLKALIDQRGETWGIWLTSLHVIFLDTNSSLWFQDWQRYSIYDAIVHEHQLTCARRLILSAAWVEPYDSAHWLRRARSRSLALSRLFCTCAESTQFFGKIFWQKINQTTDPILFCAKKG